MSAMALSRYWWILTFVVVRAQTSPPTDEASPFSLKTTPSTPTEILTYDPSQVCFNPHYSANFKNDLLSTSPTPQPNIYSSSSAGPRSTEPPTTGHLPPSSAPWLDLLPSTCVPLVYIPGFPTGRHFDHRMLKYLKRLKNSLYSNPLLAHNRTAALPKNQVQIKFGDFPAGADALPEAFPKSALVEQKKSRQARIDEMKAEKMASYLKNRRRRRRENGGSSVYPVPKFVYQPHPTPQPATIYDRNRFLAEIYSHRPAVDGP